MSNTTTSNPGAGDAADEVIHDFRPLLLVYKSGRLDRLLSFPPVPPGHDAATGVDSRDVHLSPSSFVRLYLPPSTSAAGAKLPVIVYYHGGGFVAESAASPSYHRALNDLAAACPALAVSVDYRLAPEHPLPAAYDDSLDALKWVLSAADPWVTEHGDLARIFIAGDSAGANICHHIAMHPDIKAAGTRIKGAVLIHPWFWGKEPVGEETRDPTVHAHGGRLWEFVCPGAVDGVDDPRMNPMAAAAPGLDNMACEKVMVCVAETDFLKWRGKAYAEAAAKARGAEVVEFLETEGEGHVFYLFQPACEKAKELLEKIVAFVNTQ